MLDLFDTPPLPGLATRAAFLAPEEERMLIARIDASDLAPFRFQGWTGKRLTTSFGWSYDFEVGRPKDAPPIPDWLSPFRDRAAAFAGLDPEQLVQALLIRYDPGGGDRLASRPADLWRCHRHLAWRAGGDALSSAAERRLRPGVGAA